MKGSERQLWNTAWARAEESGDHSGLPYVTSHETLGL